MPTFKELVSLLTSAPTVFIVTSILSCKIAASIRHHYPDRMGEPNEDMPKRRYRWPWIVAAAVLLGAVLAIFWMSLEVRKVEQERNLSAPLPADATH